MLDFLQFDDICCKTEWKEILTPPSLPAALLSSVSCGRQSFPCCCQRLAQVVAQSAVWGISPLLCQQHLGSCSLKLLLIALHLLCCSVSYIFLCPVEHLGASGCVFPLLRNNWHGTSLWQVWYLSVSRETATATLTWWPIPTWRTRLWSRMIFQRGTSHDASTRVGACTGRAAALSTRRKGPA